MGHFYKEPFLENLIPVNIPQVRKEQQTTENYYSKM